MTDSASHFYPALDALMTNDPTVRQAIHDKVEEMGEPESLLLKLFLFIAKEVGEPWDFILCAKEGHREQAEILNMVAQKMEYACVIVKAGDSYSVSI